MSPHEYDILFVGGGLVNSLLAWQLKRIKPWLRFLVLEKKSSLGGKHTWSFHEGDVSSESLDWLRPLISASWPFYEVAFPNYHRTIDSRYFSIRSKKFHDVIFRDLCEQVRLGVGVKAIEGHQVILENGEQLSAPLILDGRGLESFDSSKMGFQKFLGLEVELNHPHGLRGPILMDATVTQQDGYRFIYCLPWSENRVLVEDTRYSNTSAIDAERVRQEILDYCLKKGWQVNEVFDEEMGCLPLPLSERFLLGNLAPRCVDLATLRVGMRGGFFHPTTGYSLPRAVETVELLLSAHQEKEWPEILKAQSKRQRKDSRFYFWLNRILFHALPEPERYKFLEHFYTLPDDLIHAFYSDEMGWEEKLRFFLRTPPVRISRALKVWTLETVDGN